MTRFTRSGACAAAMSLVGAVVAWPAAAQPNDVYAFEEDHEPRHLWRVDVRSGETERLTSGIDSIIGYELSRDGTRLAYHRAPTPLFGDAERGEVWVSDADGGRPLRLTSNAVPEFGATLSPDNEQLLFVSASNARFEFYDNVFVVPADGGEARLVTDRFPHEVVSASWGADSRSIHVVANTGVRSELFRLDLATGTASQLTTGSSARRTTCRSSPRSATSFSNQTTGAAPATATRSCATWSAATSSRTST